jgi:signal transduction histidine kinase
MRSLRRMAMLAAGVFTLVAAGAIIGMIALFLSTREELERETHSLLVEQRIADRIVSAVYEQLFAAYRHLQYPTTETLSDYHDRGSEAYEHIRTYLFYELPLEARLEVETIKELHEGLEVVTHQAFDLAQRGDVDRAKAQALELETHAAGLRQAVGRFIGLRARERDALREAQAITLRRYVAFAIIAVLIMVVAVYWMARLLQQRLLGPLHDFSAAAARLGAGELDARLPSPRDQEFETATASFNLMAGAIESARHEVESRNAELSETLSRLQETREELIQHEKLSAIGGMLAGLAHELNNPLAGILGTAECLDIELSESADPAVRALGVELAKPLIKESLRARDLVRNLLQFSRKSNADLEPVDVAGTVDMAVGLRAHAYKQAGKRLVMQVEPGLHVTAEPRRLQHALINVINNALDALEENSGTATTIRAVAEGEEWVCITVEDDGPGFLDGARAFDAFYTSKPVGTGTGLGLTLVQRYLTECGGSVTVANLPGGGACVTMRLRRLEPPPVALVVAPDAAPPPPPDVAARRRVLVVDDEQALRELQRRLLSRLDLDVLLASSGAEARAMLESERVDAVVADVRMPGEMDGIDLFLWVEAELPDLASRFIFVTGGVQDPTLQAVLDRVPDRVISKPFQRDEYLDRVRSLLEAVAVGVAVV